MYLNHCNISMSFYLPQDWLVVVAAVVVVVIMLVEVTVRTSHVN